MLLQLRRWAALLLVLAIALLAAADEPQEKRHTNNWAVLVGASRYWFNYRHMSNTLAMYRTIKRLGIPDQNIILMLADDVACNARNVFPATVFGNRDRQMDLYGDSVEVDYGGYDVTVENFLRLLTGRVDENVPPNKRLLSDASSNVFIFMTGHGGNEFLKFQDNEELSAFDIADAVEQMWEKRRYNKLFFMIDTCQANTMFSKFYSPNVIATGSAKMGQDSLSHHSDMEIGVAVIDSFTHFVLHYLENINKTSKETLQDMFDAYDPRAIYSDPGVSTHLSRTPASEIRLTDFFGAIAGGVEVAETHEEGAEGMQAKGWDAIPSAAGDEGDEDATRAARPVRPLRPIAKSNNLSQERTTYVPSPHKVTPLQGLVGSAVIAGAGAAALAFVRSR